MPQHICLFFTPPPTYKPSPPSRRRHPHSTAHIPHRRISPSQQVKLRWHQRLNHANFEQITSWIRDGTISVLSSVTNCPHPICSACQFGKAHRRPHTQHTNSITNLHNHPGAGVSTDQFEAGTPGIIPTSKGSPTKQRYKYCTFWVDHYSKLIFVSMHTSKDNAALLQSKRNFETSCRQHGVRIGSIRSDNGIYSSHSFRLSCKENTQQLSMCGVGSHWQNGLAERMIGMIQATAHTTLLHAMAHWPTHINDTFWPFAIRHSVQLHNISCRKGSQKSPWELFTGSPPTKLPIHGRVFGCPAFVLTKSMQDNPSAAGTWSPRSWPGIYVGFSPLHSHTVAMIYNPSTQHVTPQFHVTFDESFSTVHIHDPTALETRLTQLCASKSTWHYSDIHGDPDLYLFPDITPSPEHPTVTPVVTHATTNTAPTVQNNPTYKPVPISTAFWHWKTANNIHAEVFQCTTVPSPHTPSFAFSVSTANTECTPATVPAEPYEGATNATDSTPPHSHMNDGDTLTQSAMLKAPDRPAFLQAQIPEVQGLHNQGGLHIS